MSSSSSSDFVGGGEIGSRDGGKQRGGEEGGGGGSRSSSPPRRVRARRSRSRSGSCGPDEGQKGESGAVARRGAPHSLGPRRYQSPHGADVERLGKVNIRPRSDGGDDDDTRGGRRQAKHSDGGVSSFPALAPEQTDGGGGGGGSFPPPAPAPAPAAPVPHAAATAAVSHPAPAPATVPPAPHAATRTGPSQHPAGLSPSTIPAPPRHPVVLDLNHPESKAVLEHVAAVTGLWARAAALDPHAPPDPGYYLLVLQELECLGFHYPDFRALAQRPQLAGRSRDLLLVALSGPSF